MGDRVKDMGENDIHVGCVIKLEGAIERAYKPPFMITREIGIDMGHRVFMHRSKCKNLHGHRYKIQMTLGGQLVSGGEQDGMVMDFGFMKDVMMKEIDFYFDHGMCLWIHDPIVALLLGPAYMKSRRLVEDVGFTTLMSEAIGKLYILHATPTAENLAAHWFWRVQEALHNDPRAKGSSLAGIKVWETPNCYVEYNG